MQTSSDKCCRNSCWVVFLLGKQVSSSLFSTKTTKCCSYFYPRMSDDSAEPPKKKLKTTDSQPACPYGAKCYRKNPQHLKDYSHPKVDASPGAKLPAPASSSTDCSTLPPCKYGVNCYRKNLLHFAEYWHPFKVSPQEVCQWTARVSTGQIDFSVDSFWFEQSVEMIVERPHVRTSEVA